MLLIYLRFQSENPYEGSSSHELEIFSQTFVIYLRGRVRKIYPASELEKLALSKIPKSAD